MYFRARLVPVIAEIDETDCIQLIFELLMVNILGTKGFRGETSIVK